MTDLPLWTTHLLAFAVGIVTWLPFTMWEGRRVTHHQEASMDTHPTRRRRTPRLAVIILVASLLIVGFGVQQGIYQHRAAERDKADHTRQECIASYNSVVEQVRDDRLVANKKLADAQAAKDAAGDDVLLTVLALRQKPPEAVLADLDRVLVHFARTKTRLASVTESTDEALRQNPYPTLDC